MEKQNRNHNVGFDTNVGRKSAEEMTNPFDAQ